MQSLYRKTRVREKSHSDIFYAVIFAMIFAVIFAVIFGN